MDYQDAGAGVTSVALLVGEGSAAEGCGEAWIVDSVIGVSDS